MYIQSDSIIFDTWSLSIPFGYGWCKKERKRHKPTYKTYMHNFYKSSPTLHFFFDMFDFDVLTY